MALTFPKLHDPYRPGSGPLVQPWIQPQRRSLLLFRRHWPFVSLFVITLLLVLATWSLQTRWRDLVVPLCAIVAYAIVAFCYDLADRWSESTNWQQRLRVMRKISVVLSLTALHWYLPAASTELWLLYLIPMITVGVDLDRSWATVLVSLTCLLMFLSALPMPDIQTFAAARGTYLLNGAIRAVMGGYVGMTCYLLAHALAYQTNTMRDVLGSLLDATVADRWLNMADTVAEVIAEFLSEAKRKVTMNVLVYESAEEQMRLVGSSTAAGQGLAGEGFAFHVAKGITGWAAQQNKPCFINDTDHDPEGRFLAAAAFPGTRSALAMPLRLDSQHGVVLEMESTAPYDVAYEDLHLLDHIGHYLLTNHQRSTLLSFHQRLIQLGTTLAGRIIHVNEIGTMLGEIGTVALELLDADLIRFYYHNPETNRIDQCCTVGLLQHSAAAQSPGAPHVIDTLGPATRDPLLTELMEAIDLRLFKDAQQDPLLTDRTFQNSQTAPDQEPFVLREGIVSCAAMPLIVGQEKLGLMWVSYRTKQTFPPLLQTCIQLLAPYAALAIKSSIQSVLSERQRRVAMRRIVHDSLAHRLHDVTRGLERLDRHRFGTHGWKEERMIVQQQVERARHVVENLINEHHWLTLQSVLDDLATHAQLIEKYHELAVETRFGKVPDTPISIAGGNELMYACDEILGNALRHSQATALSITAEVEQQQLRIYIADNGIGFDIDQVRLGQGIVSMRDRIERMQGTVDLSSVPEKGTLIYFEIPLDGCATVY